MKNWFEYILHHTRVRPEQPAIVLEDRVITYAMLGSGIERCARWIVAQKISGDAPVAVLVKNPIRHLVLSFALFRIGVQAISLEHGQAGIASLKPAAVLGDEEAAGLIGPGVRLVNVSDDWFTSDVPESGAIPDGFSDPAQVCRASLTSGSTGAPKLIPHRVGSFGARIVRFIDINWNLVLCMPGLSSNWGFITSCAALATGRTLCFAQSPFQAIRMIDLFSIDFVMASTEQMLALTRVARKTGARLKSLRLLWCGGSVPSRVLLQAAMTYLCNDILCRYAASEIGLVAQVAAKDMLEKPGLVGPVAPGVEVEIVDSRGAVCAPGRPGRVRCRLKENSDGFIAAEPRPLDGWIDLGDAGWLTTDGQLYIAGRATDLDDVHNAATQEISLADEAGHLLRLEWDAADAAAVTADDGGRSLLWIGVVDCKDASADKLAALLRTHGIDRRIQIFSLPAIPRSPNGKVNREQLRSLMRELAVR